MFVFKYGLGMKIRAQSGHTEKKSVIRYIWIAHLIVTFMQSAHCIKKQRKFFAAVSIQIYCILLVKLIEKTTHILRRAEKKNWFVSKLCAIKKNWGIAWNLWNICLWRADCLSNLCTRVQTRQSIKFNSIPKCAKWMRDNKKKTFAKSPYSFHYCWKYFECAKGEFLLEFSFLFVDVFSSLCVVFL